MTYRDDHEAALARADALEAELAEQREKNRALEGEVQELEGEVKELREEAALRRDPPALPPTAMKSAFQPPTLDDERPTATPPAPDGESEGLPAWAVLGLVIVALLIVVMSASSARRHREPPPSMDDDQIRQYAEEAARRSMREFDEQMRNGLLDAGVPREDVDMLYPPEPAPDAQLAERPEP